MFICCPGNISCIISFENSCAVYYIGDSFCRLLWCINRKFKVTAYILHNVEIFNKRFDQFIPSLLKKYMHSIYSYIHSVYSIAFYLDAWKLTLWGFHLMLKILAKSYLILLRLLNDPCIIIVFKKYEILLTFGVLGLYSIPSIWTKINEYANHNYCELQKDNRSSDTADGSQQAGVDRLCPDYRERLYWSLLSKQNPERVC